MVKATTDQKLTLTEFLNLCTQDVNYEFVDDHALPKVSPKYYHSNLQLTLCLLIHKWCKGKGRVVPEWAIILKRQGKDWCPVPDLTYISYQRLPKTWQDNEACPVPPELVIEIISPGQTLEEFIDKAQDYLTAGVARVWILEPTAKTIRTCSLNNEIQLYTDDQLIIDELLPGLELTVNQLFIEAELI
ncbi:MAG: Uma2 family endonuclease [Nostocales cyanobacterium]|nr:MAG: Uma2 family endonuclease [Nostocales cyanobacterium]TAF12712.1 MAG: Uma2 family endonuclease [Nostocales cyanobacterium]